MDSFLTNLRKKHVEQGKVPKMDVETIQLIIEEEWEEFINEDNMEPEGATKRILAEQSGLLNNEVFFLKALTTLIDLNTNNVRYPNLQTIKNLNFEVEKMKEVIGETTLKKLQKEWKFSGDDLA
ncbi:hypothetical protein BMWSH_5050 [Priestia megaterium WSH-002]|uniref:Uncharacterized protein n=1 Tax=Priestia megaterium (strain WSH-002) TaxID=1006007 RepID=A0A8D4DZE9_PRIMW|nr:hypothetical protein [Priestia megaterium]AEN91928.1 hypothetical protein BMWSH_5050 [Priestia megaterium WSH-002]